MPQYDAVIVITSGTGDMQRVLDIVWEKLLPAIQSEALPINDVAYEKLTKKVGDLILPQPLGKYTASLTLNVSDLIYDFPENEQNIEAVKFEFGEENVILNMRVGGTDYRFPVGHGKWKTSRNSLGLGLEMRMPDTAEQAIAASGAWVTSDTYIVKLAFFETPFTTTFNFRFDGNKLYIDSEYNVGHNPSRKPELIGIVR